MRNDENNTNYTIMILLKKKKNYKPLLSWSHGFSAEAGGPCPVTRQPGHADSAIGGTKLSKGYAKGTSP